MKQVKLGNTSLTVSALCMGTVYYGSRIGEADSFAALDHFAELGGSFLDTARVYADWLPLAKRQASEKCIGKWLKSRGRHEFILATKGGHPPLWGGRPTLGAKELARQADESRRHLGLDTLPLYYLHRDDAKLPVAAIMDALFALQDHQVIRHAACSNWTAPRIREAHEYAASCGREGFVAVSNQWSLAKPVPGYGDQTLVHMDDELAELHRKTQLPLLPFTSLAQGYLSKLAEGRPISKALQEGYGLPENEGVAARAAQVAKAHGVSVAQVCQAFFYAQDFPVIPVMSFSSFAQMAEAAAATDLALSENELQFILST